MLKRYLKAALLISGLFISFAGHADSINNLFRNSMDPVAGNPNGKITVVEFFDYQCSHCVSMAGVMNAVIKANPDLRVVYKQFPIRGPMSQLAAQAALAANLQGKYNSFSHELFRAPQPLTEKIIYTVASNAGLNVNKLKQDVQDKSIKKHLADTFTLAQQIKLTGTPAFFIGKTDARTDRTVSFVLGEMSQSELQRAIDKAKQ